MKEHQPRSERKPFPRGSYKALPEEPIEGFSLEDASVTYFTFDSEDTSIQDENAQLLIDSAVNEEDRKRLQELVDQKLGRKPNQHIPGIDGPESLT